MRRISSLRTRLVIGSVAWMIALIVAIDFLASFFVMMHPDLARRQIVHQLALTVVAIGFVFAGRYLVTRALAPLRQLRAHLLEVRAGQAARVEGTYPDEVQPLVDDLNALLDDRDQAMRRALTGAGDLAHGLKTPLAILGQHGESATAAGEPLLGASIAEQVERMRAQIEYQLTLARASASAGSAPGVACDLESSANAVARTVRTLYATRSLNIDVSIQPGVTVRGRREDIDEMLGNLLDNACKWARETIRVRSSQVGEFVVVTVDDDGDGLPPEMRARVLQRGIRADEAAPGSGLGLSIVADLAELHGGGLEIDGSPAGGLRARLRLRRV